MAVPGYGLIKTTLLDFPGFVSAVVFTAGCNLRCPWCQNPGLVRAPWDPTLRSEAEVLEFLTRRRAVLQGVVITGGEPLFLPDLPLLIEKIRVLGYRVKLDTNGTYPDRLSALAPHLVDYVAVDVKNAPSGLARSAGLPVNPVKVRRTLNLLRDRYPGRCEVRLTWVPGLNELNDLDQYADFVGPGLPVWVQAYRPGATLDPAFGQNRGPTPAEIDLVVASLRERGIDAQKRA